MFQFSEKDAIVSMCLILIGICLFYWLGILGPQSLAFPVVLMLFLCVGPLIGAGIGLIFHAVRRGMIWGLVSQLTLWSLFLILGVVS